ncbi:TIGR01777 family oxidoreductase [Luteolibacter sp. Populi]|uniref:TIGR01777 family oxidoreductase n=1 Tax=Luteolibacter sp. Populi TaxID=3230487 RepID=UPI0034669277
MTSRAETLGIVGASGFIGRELARQASAAGWQVCGYTRKAKPPDAGVAEWREWNEVPDFNGISAVVNLAGEPINQRWTADAKRRFYDSRIGATGRIVRGLSMLGRSERPHVLVNASAVGIYGERGDEILEEGSPTGTGYLAELCQAWEDSADGVARLGPRVLKWRTGLVLGREGEAFKKMLLPFRLGLGGRLGSGKQWVPWIHVADLVGGILHGIGYGGVTGPVNGSAPEPERNEDFTRKLAAALQRPAALAVPEFALRWMMGDFASAMVASHRAVPRVLLESGYKFRFPTLEMALGDLVGKEQASLSREEPSPRG